MNLDQLSSLARRADDLGGSPEARLDEVHLRIKTVRRRRTTGALVGAGALVVAAVLAVGTLTRPSGSGPEPAPRPDEEEPAAVSTRELTWTDEWWPSRRINYGDTVLDTRPNLPGYELITQMDVSDDGVVATTRDGRIWLVDTDSVEQIGTTGPPNHVGEKFIFSGDWINTGNAGSLVAWPDPRGPGVDELVVYDTGLLREVARISFGQISGVSWVGTDRVYVQGKDNVRRLDVATGKVTTVSAAEYADDLRSRPRNLVVGESFETGEVSDGIDVMFVRRGSRLVAAAWGMGSGATIPECGTDRCETSAFATSGAPIRLRVPDGYDGARSFTVFQWLDDDRLAMMAGAGSGFVFGIDNDLPADNTGYGDIMVCRISTGQCRLAVGGPEISDAAAEVAPDQFRVVPDFGPIGTN